MVHGRGSSESCIEDLGKSVSAASNLVNTNNGPQPTSDGLQPASDGLQPTSGGLLPNRLKGMTTIHNFGVPCCE